MEIKLDMMQTAALAVVVYYFGAWVKTKIQILEKFCIPAPVVGGLIFAFLHLFLRQSGALTLELDTTLQKPFMMVFFTSIGMGASIELIKKGGLQVVIFWLVASLLCVFQNAIGVALAKVLNQSPFLGMLCGSVTMTGGHGTGGAFGPYFEKNYGVVGATATAMAAATFGLVMGSLIGGPIGKRLIEAKNLKPNTEVYESADSVIGEKEEAVNYDELFRTLTLILVSIGIGAILEKFFVSIGVT
ncbi:sodium/glutamate symporter, partial [Clostridium cochlearium]|nr:sodium/glutamate symporter [Clostridium cochlearium]